MAVVTPEKDLNPRGIISISRRGPHWTGMLRSFGGSYERIESPLCNLDEPQSGLQNSEHAQATPSQSLWSWPLLCEGVDHTRQWFILHQECICYGSRRYKLLDCLVSKANDIRNDTAGDRVYCLTTTVIFYVTCTITFKIYIPTVHASNP